MENNSINRDEHTLKRSKKEILKRLAIYLNPHKIKAFIVVILMVFVMLSGILNPYLLQVAIDKYAASENIKGILLIGGILVIINSIAWVLSKIRWEMISEITNTILVDIRKELYTHIQKLSFDFFDSRPVGKILARVVGDVNALKNLFNQSIQTVIPEMLNLICVCIAMMMLNFKLAIACMMLLPLLALTMFLVETKSRKRWNDFRNKRSNLNGFTHENFSGVKVVQAFAKEHDVENTYREMVKKEKDAFLSAIRLNDLFWPMVELSWGIGTLIVFAIGYKLIISGEIQIGKLIAFSMYTGMFWRPITNLSSFYNTMITNFAAADRIFDILDINPEIENSQDAIKIGNIVGNVDFKNVTFAYNNGGEVLSNVNFKIKEGERVALVGSTGAGKTTIISLLSRFYDPIGGKILIDGKNIKKIDLESYRSQMGIMLQDTFLFSTSIKENIRYGRLDATDEEVIEAAKAVNAHEFIMKMEKGYDTEVNERGSRLSLGQRQLVSFARALLANPRILILDEATSNIDTETERLVQAGIEKLLIGRTSFVIAHRLSTIRDCDKIMVVEDGGIKEIGTHEELIEIKGSYYNLYMAQYKFISQGA